MGNKMTISELELIDMVGDNLRDLLIETGYSQNDLAKEAGLSQASVSRYINKQRLPNLRAVINMSYVLECSIDDIVPNLYLIEGMY